MLPFFRKELSYLFSDNLEFSSGEFICYIDTGFPSQFGLIIVQY